MTSIAASSEIVAVVLSAQGMPEVMEITAADSMAARVRLAGKDYSDSGAGDWLGFYDWLWNSEGKIIGVQQWIDEVSTYPFSKNFLGVQADVNCRVVRIFFGQSREVDESTSCSQDFGNNRLLISGDSVALTFSTMGTK